MQYVNKNIPLFKSRPSRARGLKQEVLDKYRKEGKSRPSRARGLKLLDAWACKRKVLSRPSRARGLKQVLPLLTGSLTEVAPFAGAWIETRRKIPGFNFLECRALRGRVD